LQSLFKFLLLPLYFSLKQQDLKATLSRFPERTIPRLDGFNFGGMASKLSAFQ